MLNFCHFYVSIRELHCMHSNCNNALCNTLFIKNVYCFSYCTMCIVVNRAACTNPLYSLLLVQCLFWWFLTLLKLRPLRMRSRSSTPLMKRRKWRTRRKTKNWLALSLQIKMMESSCEGKKVIDEFWSVLETLKTILESYQQILTGY